MFKNLLPSVLLGISVGAYFSLPSTAFSQNMADAANSEVGLGSKALDLRQALIDLSLEPDSYLALVNAGVASREIGDHGASEGFFSRALQISPDAIEAKLGLASIYVRTGRPTLAIELLNEVEEVGGLNATALGDRGLANDLVGNNGAAQDNYRASLAMEENSEITKRFAISLAISAMREDFEFILQPLLDRNDPAARRTKALGLAILGDLAGAQAIAEDVLQPQMAERMTLYFENMVRLTKTQKAYAANLGVFPTASEIGEEGESNYSFNPRRLAFPTLAVDSNTDPSRLTEAFNDFVISDISSAVPSSGAVDITAIEITRERVVPPPPRHPERYWVQVAIGRNLSALRRDWRQIKRRAGRLLNDSNAYSTTYTTPRLQTNLLLTGPFETRAAANNFSRRLNAQNIESLPYRSPEGKEVNRLR